MIYPEQSLVQNHDGIITAIMNLHLSFEDRSGKRNYPKLLSALENAVRIATPTINENNGKVICVSEQGIVVIFERNPEDALKCAISISQQMLSISDGTDKVKVSIGIHYGKIFIRSMVFGDLQTTLAISDALELTRRLSSYCLTADTHILVTEIAAGSIRNFNNRYGVRKLGLVYVTTDKKERIIYDIYDGDVTEKKYSKQRSKLFFETGVNHFLAGSYLQARSCFIELLKFDRSDSITKRYIMMCDKALSEQKQVRYLDTW